MKNIKYLFGWLVIIGPIHMIEQMIFGLDELQELKRVSAVYHSWFADPDFGTVLLVTIAGATSLLMMYGLLAGGRLQLIVVALLGFLSVGEVHHVAKTVVAGRYNPGVITSVPFAAFGGLLFYAAVTALTKKTPSQPEELQQKATAAAN